MNVINVVLSRDILGIDLLITSGYPYGVTSVNIIYYNCKFMHTKQYRNKCIFFSFEMKNKSNIPIKNKFVSSPTSSTRNVNQLVNMFENNLVTPKKSTMQ